MHWQIQKDLHLKRRQYIVFKTIFHWNNTYYITTLKKKCSSSRNKIIHSPITERLQLITFCSVSGLLKNKPKKNKKQKNFNIQPSMRITLDIWFVSHFVHTTWYCDQFLLSSKLVENLICIDVVWWISKSSAFGKVYCF